MRFGSVDVAGLEHSLEACDSMLFVELRALREVNDAIEVFDLEQIGSALSTPSDDLGSDDLREATLPKRVPKRFEGRCLDAKDRADSLATQRKWTVIEDNLLPHLNEIGAGRKRKRFIGFADDLQVEQVDFVAIRCAAVLPHATHETDRIVALDVNRRWCGANHLDGSACVLDDDERRSLQGTQEADPASKLDLAVNVRMEVACEDTFSHPHPDLTPDRQRVGRADDAAANPADPVACPLSPSTNELPL
jgi:hypothetical protein